MSTLAGRARVVCTLQVMIRGESILTRPMPPENGQTAAGGEAARKRDENVNPFVAQQVVDVDAMRKQTRRHVGKVGPRFSLSLWCALPAVALLAWCGLHAYMGHMTGMDRETLIAIGTGVGATLAAFVIAILLAKLIDPGRVAASITFCAILAITGMASLVRVVVHKPQMATATPLTTWLMEPFLERPLPQRELARPSLGDDEADVAMQQLADRMRAGTIDTSKMGKTPVNTEKSDIRMTVRKRKPVTAEGELAEAKEGE